MAGKFQSYREWQEEKRNAESAGQEAGGNTRFQTYAQWRQERQTPEERDRYYQASGMDSFRRDFSKYAAYDIVKDEANREWEQNIRNQRDYFTRYASHFTKDQIAAFNQELDLYESIVRDRSAYARVQPDIILAQGQQAQYAKGQKTQRTQRESAYDETGLRADTQLYKNPQALRAMEANGDAKAAELRRKRYQALEKEYGNSDSGRTQRESREKRMRELDAQLAVVQQNLNDVTRNISGPLPNTEEGRKTANQIRTWNMQRDRLLAEKQAISQQEDVKTGIYAAQEEADGATRSYMKAAQEFTAAKSQNQAIADGILGMYERDALYQELSEAKRIDEEEAQKTGEIPTYQRFREVLKKRGMTDEDIEQISTRFSFTPWSQAVQDAKEKKTDYEQQAKTLRVKAQRQSDAWEYEVAKAYSDKDFAALSKPSKDKMPEGTLGDAYNVMTQSKESILRQGADFFDTEVEIGGKTLTWQELTEMSDEEKKLFFYFCNTGDEDMAALWLSSNADALKYRRGETIAELADYPVLREIYALGSSAVRGAELVGYGIGSIFADIDAPDVTADEYALSSLSQRNKNSFAGFMIGAAQNIGNMAPSLAGYAVNPALGVSATFLNARGNAYVEAKREGFTHGQAWIYSTLVGASEAGLEKVLGGMGGIAKGALPEKLLAKIPETNSIVWKLVKDYGIHASSELIEENLQNYLDPAFAMIAGMTDQYDAPGMEDFIETSVVTAITTLFFSASQAPAKVRQEKINQAAGRWADAAIRLGEDNPAYNEGVKLRETLDSGENVSREQMLAAFERAGDENATKIAKEADVDKIVQNAKAQLKDVKAGWFTWDTAIGDAESVTEVWEQSLMEAYESGDEQEVLKTAASAVKLAESAQINLDNAYKLTRISLDEHEAASDALQKVKNNASEVIENYRNGIWSNITPLEQQTQEEAAQEQKTQFEQAYIDAGAPEDIAKTAGEVLDGIVSGEITSQNITNRQIMELMADTGYGREAIAQTLGVEVTEEKTTSAMRRAVKRAIAQYENNTAQQAAAGTQRAVTAKPDTTEGGNENAAEGTQSVRRDGGRNDGVDSGEQAGGLGESGSQRTAQRRAEGNGQQNNEKALRRQRQKERIKRYESLTDTTDAQKIFNSTKYEGDIAVVPEELYTQKMRDAAREVEDELGVKVVYFKGTLIREDASRRMRRTAGFFDTTRNEIWATVGSELFEPEQLVHHEKYHAEVAFKQADVMQTVDKITEQFDVKELEALVQRYVRAYAGVYDNESVEDIYEELLADAYAGMNRFGDTLNATQYQKAVKENVKRGTRENERAMRDTRGAPESKFSFAGERSKTADMEALALAKEMQDQDVDRETILRETGWFVGADGKWRYEIDDSTMEFRKDGDARLLQEEGYRRLEKLTQKWADSFENGEALTNAEEQEMQELQEQYEEYVWQEKYLLRDFLKHDELFEAYPYMNRISLVFDDLPMGENGYFSRRSNTIVLSDKLFGKERETVLHEIQHIIQKVEDFARGASPEYWERRMEDGFSKRWDNGIEMMPSEMYRNTAGEIEARDAAARMNMTEDERRNTFPDIGDENTVFAEREETSYSTKDDVLKIDGVDWMDNYSSIKDQLTKHSEKINKLDPVCIVEFNPGAKTKLSTAILETVNKIGGKNMKNKNVSFEFDEKGTGNILSHAKSAELQAAALAAPYVAKYGDLIAGQKNHESTGLTTLTFAAPVIINGDTVNVGVAIQFQKNGKPRAVNVEYQSGEKFVIDTKKVPAGLDSRVERYVQGTSLPTTGTNKSIRNDSVKVNMYDGESASNIGEFDRENKDIRFSFDDEDYLLAVRAGDMDAAQEMVDEAAQKTGYTVKAYHGTNENFNVFRSEKGRYFFSKSEDYAEAMMEERSGQRIVKAYLKMENPYREKLAEGQFSDPSFEKPILDYAEQNGYDSAIIEVDTDNEMVQDTFYVVFSQEQIKSADPVTYDDNGKLIPISERFDTGSKDIRYSIEDETEGVNNDFDALTQDNPKPPREGRDIKQEIKETLMRGQETKQMPTATVTRTMPESDAYGTATTVTHEYGIGKPFYSRNTTLTPKEAIGYLEAATGMKWQAVPMKKGLWKAEMTTEELDTVFAPKGYSKYVVEMKERGEKPGNAKQYAQEMLAKAWRDPQAPSAATVHPEGVRKENFSASPALEKIGVKIDGSVVDYETTQQIRQAEDARFNIQKTIKSTIRRYGATNKEVAHAKSIAEGVDSYFDIPQSCRFHVVSELAGLYMDERMAGNNLVSQRKIAIKTALLDKAIEMFPQEKQIQENPDLFNPTKLLTMNYRTPERNMRKIFGDELGGQIYDYYFAPVQANEAERTRWMQKQFDEVRKFRGEDGKLTKLNKAESAYTHEILDLQSYVEKADASEKKTEILKAAEKLRRMQGEGKVDKNTRWDLAVEFDLDRAQSEWMMKYAQWLTMKEGKPESVDETKCMEAAKKYRELFDNYFDAINDFLVSHGGKPIGKIEGYAPHISLNEKVNLLNQTLEKLGFNDNATKLPAEIAGMTEEFRPDKRWTPFFQKRNGSKTDYDIVEGFERYVTYISDVLYHMDDIQKLRAAESYLRMGMGGSFDTSIEEAIEKSRMPDLNDRIDYLIDAGRIEIKERGDYTEQEVTEAFSEFIDSLIKEQQSNTRYSDLAQWMQNYTNILAGKQFGGDRGIEHMGGRGLLTLGNRINAVFARANVAGNISSALNQTAQLPAILSERRASSVAQALGEFTTGKLREFSKQSDYITSKKGVKYVARSAGDMFIEGVFKPVEFVDSMMSTLAVRSAYLDGIKNGMTEAEAMRFADNFGRKIMADRSKGSKPNAFHSKGFVKQMLHMFQIEALNSWQHIANDLPSDFRAISKDRGKASAARALAGVMVKYLIAAFVLNRWAEETYGGTPAPFDLIGMTSNFIASGNGLSTNEWIRRTINKVTGVDVFEESAAVENEEFEWGSAIEDTTYNLSNEVPFVSNLSGMLGVGDRTLPTAIPGFVDAVKGIYNALTDGDAFDADTALALVDLLKTAVPGGRQLGKMVSGIRSAIEGGKMNGTGENERLQYVTNTTLLGVLQQILFGPNATAEAKEHYAAGESGLSAAQTMLWKNITEQGGDGQELFALIQRYREIENDEDLTTEERGELRRNEIAASGFTDEQKAYIYSVLFGGEDGTSQDEPFEKLMDAGMSWDEITKMFNEFKRIYYIEDIKPTEQTTKFQYWLDQQSYTKEQRDIIDEEFRYYSFVSSEPEKTMYSKLRAQGVSPEEALRIVENTKAQDGESVKPADKIDSILKQGMSEEKTYEALGAVLNEGVYGNLTEARAAGISCKTYIDFWQRKQKLTADKDPDDPEKTISGSKKKKVIELIDSLPLSSAQKDVLILQEYPKTDVRDMPWN